MIRHWGHTSRISYDTLDIRLQRVCNRVLNEVCDITLIEGHRGETAQNNYFDIGTSHLRWPDGNHNSLPSLAVDLQPYPRPNDKVKLACALGFIAGHAQRIGKEEGVTIRWGGDWDQDGDLTDQTFDDLFHIEIVE